MISTRCRCIVLVSSIVLLAITVSYPLCAQGPEVQIILGDRITGEIRNDTDEDVYEFPASVNDTVSLTISPNKKLKSPLTPSARLINKDTGQEIVLPPADQKKRTIKASGKNAVLIPASGVYCLIIARAAGTTENGGYLIKTKRKGARSTKLKGEALPKVIKFGGEPGSLLDVKLKHKTLALAATLRKPDGSSEELPSDTKGRIKVKKWELHQVGTYTINVTAQGGQGGGNELSGSVKVKPPKSKQKLTEGQDEATPPTASPSNFADNGFVGSTTPLLVINLTDTGSGINPRRFSMTVNGADVTSLCTFYSGANVVPRDGCTPPDRVECQLNALNHLSSNPTDPNAIALNLVDNDGNTGAEAFNIFADTIAPNISVDSPTGIIATSTPLIDISFNDDESGIDTNEILVTINGADRTAMFAVTGAGAQWQVDAGDPLPEGNITIVASIKDKVGNQNSDAKVPFVDTIAPDISIDSPTGAVASNTPLIQISYVDPGSSGIDVTTFKLMVNGVDRTDECIILPTGAQCQIDGNNPLPDGTNTIVASIKDVAGNENSDTQTPFVDTTQPTISVNSPTGNINTNTPLIDISYDDGAGTGVDTSTLSVTVNGVDRTGMFTVTGAGAQWQVDVPNALPEGNNTIVATVKDNVGNQISDTETPFVDTTPPTILINSPTGNINTNTPLIDISYNDGAGTGIDASTLSVTVNGVDRTSMFNVTGTGAQWQVGAPNALPEGINTIVATIQDNLGNQNSDTATPFVDTTQPTISIDSPTGNINTNTPLIDISYDDGAGTGVDTSTLSVTVNGVDRTGTFSVTGTGAQWQVDAANQLPDGNNTIVATIKDKVGNQNSDTETAILVDTVAPNISVDAPTGNINTQTPLIQISYSDGAGAGVDLSTFSVTVNGVDRTSNFTVTGTGAHWQVDAPNALLAGANTIIATISDLLGQQNSDTESPFVDMTLPTITVNSPTGVITTNTPLIDISFNDAESGIDTSQFSVTINGTDRTGMFTLTGPGAQWQVDAPNGLPEGNNTIIAAIKDNAGNQNSDTKIPFVDTIAPAISIDSPTGFIGTATPLIQISYSDGGSGIDTGQLVVTVDGADQTSKFNVTGAGADWQVGAGDALTEGQHTIAATIKDFAGNQNSDTETPTVDITQPTISVDSPTGMITDNTPQIQISYSDGGSGIDATQLIVMVNGFDKTGNFTIGPSSALWQVDIPNALPEGNNTIVATIKDNVGNQNSDTENPFVDTILPTISITFPTGNINTNTPLIQITYSDGGSGLNTGAFSLKVNGVDRTSECTINPTNAQCQILGGNPLPEGANTIVATIEDTAGNQNSDTANPVVDTTPPNISITSPTGFINSPTPTVTMTYSDAGTGVDASTFTLTVNTVDVTGLCSIDANSATCDLTGNPLNEGTNTIIAVIKDNANNQNSDTANPSVDTTPPTISIDSPTGTITTPTPLIVISYSDPGGSGVNIATFTITVNSTNRNAQCTIGPAGAQCQLDGNTAMIASDNTVSVQIDDMMGNTASDSETITVNIPEEDGGPFDGLRSAIGGNGQVCLYWNPSTVLGTEYEIFKSTTSPVNTGGSPDFTTSADVIFFCVQGVSNGTKYYFVVQSKPPVGGLSAGVNTSTLGLQTDPTTNTHELSAIPSSNVIYVDDSNTDPLPNGTIGNPYKTIQDAIDNVSGVTNIYVAEGTYNERPVLVSDVYLAGGFDSSFAEALRSPRSRVSTVDGGAGGDTLTAANDTAIDGFSIINGTDGVSFSGATPTISIVNNKITGNSADGVNSATTSGGNPTIINNAIMSNYRGVNLKDFPVGDGTVSIINNFIKSNTNWGVYQYGNSQVGLIENTISNNYAGGGLLYVGMGSSTSEIIANVTNNYVKSNATGPGLRVIQASFNASRPSVKAYIENNLIKGNVNYGLYRKSSGKGDVQLLLEDNIIRNTIGTGVGISSYASSNDTGDVTETIRNNLISSNYGDGISRRAYSSRGLVTTYVENNTLIANDAALDCTVQSRYTGNVSSTIQNNLIADNYANGVRRSAEGYDTVQLIFTSNIIRNNLGFGLNSYMRGDDDNVTTTISNNIITNNDYGITMSSEAYNGGDVFDTVSDNIIVGAQNSGVYASSSAIAGQADFTGSNNVIANTGGNGMNVQPYGYNGATFTISNCVVSNSGDTGISAYPATYTSNVSGTISNNAISNAGSFGVSGTVYAYKASTDLQFKNNTIGSANNGAYISIGATSYTVTRSANGDIINNVIAASGYTALTLFGYRYGGKVGGKTKIRNNAVVCTPSTDGRGIWDGTYNYGGPYSISNTIVTGNGDDLGPANYLAATYSIVSNTTTDPGTGNVQASLSQVKFVNAPELCARGFFSPAYPGELTIADTAAGFDPGDTIEIANDGVARTVSNVVGLVVTFAPSLTTVSSPSTLVVSNFETSTNVDEDYRLDAGSPAIDAGKKGASQKDTDGTRNDIGAFGGPDATPSLNDVGVFGVMDVDPRPGDVVSTATAPVTVSFSRPADGGSVDNTTFSVVGPNGAVGGTFSGGGTSRVTFTPSADMVFGEHIVTIVGGAAGILDPDGNSLNTDPGLVSDFFVAVQSVAESEPNDNTGSANAISDGDAVGGAIDTAGDVDYFSFSGNSGEMVSVAAYAERIGSSLDSVLTLFDTDGTTQLAADDNTFGLDSAVTFELTSSGTFFLKVEDKNVAGGASYNYVLSLEIESPVGSFALVPGGAQSKGSRRGFVRAGKRSKTTAASRLPADEPQRTIIHPPPKKRSQQAAAFIAKIRNARAARAQRESQTSPQALIANLTEGDVKTRRIAVRRLHLQGEQLKNGRHRDPANALAFDALMSALQAALNDADRKVRMEAIRTLGSLGDETALQALEAAANREVGHARMAAKNAMKRIQRRIRAR